MPETLAPDGLRLLKAKGTCTHSALQAFADAWEADQKLIADVDVATKRLEKKIAVLDERSREVLAKWEADRKAMWFALNLLERADHQHYASDAEDVLRAALRGEEAKRE